MSARVPKRDAPPPGKPPGAGPVKSGGAGGADGLAKKPPQHYKVGKWIFTPLSIAEFCGVLVLGIMGVSFTVSAYRDFKLKYNFDKALVFYASNQAGNATDRLTGAISARTMEDWPYPYLLQAKVNVNEGKLEEAQAGFEKLATVKVGEKNWTRAHQASTKVGLGCIALRRYDDALEKQKPQPKLLDEAKAAFKEAQSIDEKCLEAGIGLAHVALRAGWDPALGAINQDACNLAQAELKKVDAAGLTPTIDGLVDKYMAQGRIAYERQDYSGAELEFRRAFQLQPGWKAPFANVAFMMSRYFSVSGVARLDEMAAKQQEFDEFVQRLESLYNSDTERYAVFKEAMFSFFNSMGYAFCKGFRHEVGFTYLDRAGAIDNVRPTIAINKADLFLFYADSNKYQEQEQLQHANNAREQWLRAAEQCRSTQQPRKRMLCLYNRAIILYNKNPKEMTYLENAWNDLKDLAREFPGEPLILRAQAALARRKGEISDAARLLAEARAAWEKMPESDEKRVMKEDFDKFEEDLKKGKIDDEPPPGK